VDSTLVKDIFTSILESVIKDEPKITEYDTIAGDGDCGETLLKGVKG
jgi:dihydroxyacetone kinase